MAHDTLAKRWADLQPHVQVYGAADDVRRPAVLLFHGCGGIAPNLLIYAEAAVRAGARAYIIDSFSSRGWSRKFGAAWVCKGLKLRGYERSGDVLAALWGIAALAEVDGARILLAGWSHGAWAIMDLMTQACNPGDAMLADPTPEPLDGVRGLFLAYPYINIMARSVTRPWHHRPKTLAVLSLKDHLASYEQSLKLVRRLRTQGVDTETVTVDSTHAFDEEGIDRTGFMRYDEQASQATLQALQDFMRRTLG